MVKSAETRVSDFLTAYEKMRDILYFPQKSPMDDLTCVICNGYYRRRDKSKHAKGKKHKLMLPLILSGTVTPYIEWINFDCSEDPEIVEQQDITGSDSD